ncbi:hypothetical protein BH10ACI1_BH10ACI1_06710 [soil metagenome]
MKRKILIGFMTAFFLLTFFSFAPTEAVAQSKKAKKLVSDAEKLFQSKNYQGAIDKYAEAIVLEPTYPDAYFWKGYAHYYLNQYDQAIQDLTTALQQGFKNSIEIYKLRGYMNLQRQNYDAAFGDINEAAKREPTNIVYVMNLGEIYRGKKDWTSALEAYKRAAQLEPRSGDISYFIAVCYGELGNFDAQGTAVQDAIQKGTKYVGESYYLYGNWQQRSRNSLEAMQSYERALSAKPTIYEAYGLLSEIYRGQGRFDDAIKITLKGLENFPNDGSLYINLTWYYSLADKYKEAIDAGLMAVKYAPDSATGYTNLCRAYNDIKQYGTAIETCNKALAIAPNDGETNFYLGRAYSFLKREDVAKKYYANAVMGLIEFTNANPEYSDGFYLLGNAYFTVGNRDKAIEAYQRCLELSPRFAKARFNLGYIYFLKGDKNAARQQYEELKKFDVITAEKLKQAMEQ